MKKYIFSTAPYLLKKSNMEYLWNKSSHNKYFRLNDFSIEVLYTSKEGLHILLYMILYIYVIVYIDIFILYICMCNTYMSIYTYMYIKANRVLPQECNGHS